MAESVMRGSGGPALSPAPVETMQRDGDEEKKPPQPNNYGEAAKKIGDAVQETPFGKQLKAKAEELGKEFLSSVEGKVVAGSALGGALAAIIATNSELPVPIPELPLDFIRPGLKAKLTYEGPVQKPTNVGITLTSKGGVSLSAGYIKTAATPGKPAEEKVGLGLTIPLGGSSTKKKAASESDKIAAETAQLRADQANLREANKTPAEKKADADFMKSYLHYKQDDPLNPLNLGKKKDDLLLMRSATDAAGPGVAPPIVHDVLASGGQSLDHATQAFMEERFDYDFSGVRLHTDEQAAASARAVNAHAYTVGSHIAFDSARFSPASQAGRRLLAHELAHVVQQGRPEPAPPAASYFPAPALLMRQGNQSNALPLGVYQYDRSDFSDRFDGEVDSRNHRVVLTMRLAINDAVGADSEKVKEGRIATFFTAAKDAIEKAWRGATLVLKSNCMADVYSVGVNLLLDYRNPHQTITLWNDQGERSSSTEWQLSDTQAKTSTSPVLRDAKKPPSKENVQEATFSQVPVVHEFGHLMGLEHPVCKGNEERCYGVTFEQKNDLMGHGSAITARDMEPFLRIMRRYGQDHLPKECNDWKAVSP